MEQTDKNTLLNECREMMTRRIRSSMTVMMHEIDNRLMELAFNEGGSVNNSAYLDAMRELKMKKSEIMTRFERRFIAQFEQDISLSNDGIYASDLGEMNTPVNYATINIRNIIRESESIENTVKHIRTNCRSALLELDKKVSLLLDEPQLNTLDNPMKPETICDSFHEACKDMRMEEDIRLMIFDSFKKYITSDLELIYADINTLLDQKLEHENRLARKSDRISREEFAEKAASKKKVVLIRYKVSSILDRKLKGHRVPNFIRVFIFKHWRGYLEYIHAHHGAHGREWHDAMQTIDDLAWSVENFTTAEDKARLSKLLPGLLERLKSGIRHTGMPYYMQNNFFKALRQHHINLFGKEIMEDISTPDASYADDYDQTVARLPARPEEKD